MKINNKYHWDKFIYGLLYPGFVGSMIYELIPQEGSQISHFWAIQTLIKIFITLFYCVDYLHLYGDMDKIVILEKRSKTYLFCDVFSSIFFFACFVCVKLNQINYAILILSIIPVFFLLYKRKNKFDLIFHIPYLVLSFATGILFFSDQYYNLNWFEPEKFLLFFIITSFVIYSAYVFIYYDKKSLAIDLKIYT